MDETTNEPTDKAVFGVDYMSKRTNRDMRREDRLFEQQEAILAAVLRTNQLLEWLGTEVLGKR